MTSTLFIPALGTVACAATLWMCHRALRQRDGRIAALNARLAAAQLAALRLQINPHLLFNALNDIASLTTSSPATAQRMIARLGELLRAALENTSTPQVPLAREIDFVRRYLEIEQLRFGSRLNIDIQSEPEALDAAVPDLILQPLVENAIRHSVALRETGGTIALRARRSGMMLVLQVADNGRGRDASSSASPPATWRRPGSNREGIGLSNTRQRLERLYGSSQRLELAPNESGGFTASVTIPYQLAAA